MLGGPQYEAQMIKAGLATRTMSRDTKALDKAMKGVTERSWLMNQGLFTARRFMFYGTIAAGGMAAAVIKMGFSYESAMQQARVALAPVYKNDLPALQGELNQLFRIAALTPFTFKDTTIAFRQLFAAFHGAGLTAKDANDTMMMMMNALSYAGKVTPGALNRVSVALQHMMYLGRPTGQTILQLARDGLPIYAALHKELGLTDDQMRNMSASGISSVQVLKALQQYIRTTPGFAGAAIKQANQTLFGSLTTFKDLVSQAAGGGERGMFFGLTKIFHDVNVQLYRTFYNRNEPVTFTRIAQAFDKVLSPKAHTVMNLFVLFSTYLKVTAGGLVLVAKILGLVIGKIEQFGNVLGINIPMLKIIAWYLGILSTLWLINAGRVIALGLAMDIFKFSVMPLGKLLIFTNWLIKAQIFDVEALTLRYWYARDAVLAFGRAQLIAFLENPWAILLAAVIVLTVAAVILYFKWKKFHDLVNSFFRFIIKFAPVVAVELALAFGPIGVALGAVLLLIKYWKQLTGMWHHGGPTKVPGAGGDKIGSRKSWGYALNPKHFGQDVGAAIGTGFKWSLGGMLIRRRMPWHQMGGTVAGPIGSPQLIMAHGGERVTPVGQSQWDRATDRPIHVHVMVDRKEIAAAVARANQDYAARR